MAPSRHDWKIVDWDVKPQHNQIIPQVSSDMAFCHIFSCLLASGHIMQISEQVINYELLHV